MSGGHTELKPEPRTIYVQWSIDGNHIRKWNWTEFELAERLKAETIAVSDPHLLTILREAREALEDIAQETSAEEDAGENYRWDDREGALDYAYARARATLAKIDEVLG